MSDSAHNKDEPFELSSRALFAQTTGARLRSVRRRRGMSLAELAAATGLSRSFLSRAERGITTASIGSLLTWTRALDLTVSMLFEPDWEPLHRSTRAPAFAMPGVADYLLTPADETRFEVFEEHLEPGSAPDSRFWSVDADSAFIYVIRGTVDIEFDHGARVSHLSAGDLLVYNPREPHRWSNTSQGQAVLLIFESPARRF